MSSGSPRVGLLAEFEVDERLGARHARHGPDPAQDLEQLVIVFADDLGQHVEGARADHDVVDLFHLGQLVGDLLQVTVGLDGDHRLALEAEHEGIGDRDDLHDPGLLQPLHALPDGCLGKPDRLADRRVGTPAVFLQLLDDLLGDIVEYGTTRAVSRERPRAVRHAVAPFSLTGNVPYRPTDFVAIYKDSN